MVGHTILLRLAQKSCFVPAGALFSGQILTDMRTSAKRNAEKILLPFVHTRRISLGKSIQPHERKQSVQHQQLISETIAVDRSGPDVQQVATHGCRDTNPRDSRRPRFAPGKHTESKQAQQRPVSVRSHHINGIDDTGIVYGFKTQDKADKEQSYHSVYPLSYRLRTGKPPLHVQNVHTKTGSLGCQCGIRTAERRRDNTDSKQHQHFIP